MRIRCESLAVCSTADCEVVGLFGFCSLDHLVQMNAAISEETTPSTIMPKVVCLNGSSATVYIPCHYTTRSPASTSRRSQSILRCIRLSATLIAWFSTCGEFRVLQSRIGRALIRLIGRTNVKSPRKAAWVSGMLREIANDRFKESNLTIPLAGGLPDSGKRWSQRDIRRQNFWRRA